MRRQPTQENSEILVSEAETLVESALTLEDFSLVDLVAEVETRTACAPDLGLSAQVCPRCSTAQTELCGEYSRVQRRFSCPACQLTLTESRYEVELDRFGRQRWRARRDATELVELARTR